MAAVAPVPHYFEIIAPGNGFIANLTKQGDNFGGPIALDDTLWDFGQVLGGEWVYKRFVFGYQGSTADQMYFWLYDYMADVGGVVDAQNFFSGTGNWSFAMQISGPYVNTFTDPDTDSSWVSIAYGATNPNPNNLKAMILAQTSLNGNTGGNNNGPAMLIPAINYTNQQLYLTNCYIHIAIKPDPSALPGEQTNWGFRQKYVYP
jgi:hypothetical protein